MNTVIKQWHEKKPKMFEWYISPDHTPWDRSHVKSNQIQIKFYLKSAMYI